MNNIGILKDLLKTYADDIERNNQLLIALLIFISINLITTIINIISQHKLKSKDKSIISFKIKEQKRISIFESIYRKLDKMTFLDGKTEADELLQLIQNVEKSISKNKLYIHKKNQKLMYDITDYFKTTLTDYRKKDYSKELKLFDKLSSNFGK
ncbi:hypothetical protein [uncultured Winogradskyella sp.]|uniref:hypothetical protein n=1 Tax=uncultured Winogradskyella sp. TaxID=395353 RepID=UPI00262868CC|nr:hypothetical protein [uncultured Winogradskyella sp.]